MKQYAVRASEILVLIFALILVALLFTAPMLIELYSTLRKLPEVVYDCILYTFYLCAIPIGLVLFSMAKLLRNIEKEQIFIEENSRILSCISICCVVLCLLTLAAAYHYLPFALIAIAMIFIALIVRVVQRCMLAGTLLKEENNLTI